MNTPDSKRVLLAATYCKMPTEELRRRVASGMLVPVAQELAELELKRRVASDMLVPVAQELAKLELKDRQKPLFSPKALPEGAIFFADARTDAFAQAIALLGGLGVAWLLVDTGFFILIVTAIGPAILAIMGKLFPRIGAVLGCVAAAAPFALAYWMWQRGELTSNGRGFEYTVFFSWIALFVSSTVCWVVANVLLMGAFHKGSWQDFHRILSEKTSNAIGKITER